ncbi:MAG: hypothetical protein R6U27_05470 [Desulfobacterales bacterium]
MTPSLTLQQKLVIPSLFDLIVTIIFIIMILADPMIKCYDIFWHLRTGELLLNGIYPQTDLFSYTAFGKPWILHEWGSQVIFAFIYQNLGFAGLIVFKSLVYALMYGLAFKLMLKKNIHIFLSIGLILMLVLGTAFGLTVRPHMFTYLFLVILFWIYVCFQDKGNQKILWALPVLFLFWINLHGGFAIGFVFLGVCLAAELINCVLNISSDRAGSRTRIRQLSIWTGLSLAACFINPNTVKGVLYPLMYLGDQMDNKTLQEWVAPSMHTDIHFFILMMFTFAGLVFKTKKLQIHEILLVLTFAVFAFSARRHIPLFTIVTIPVMAGVWQSNITALFHAIHASTGHGIKKLMDRISLYMTSRGKDFAMMEKKLNVHLVAVFVILVMAGISLAAPENLNIGLDKTKYPIEMVDHIKANDIQGNLFNQYRWGGFLLWAIPDQKVFIDGRMDVYQKEISNLYYTIINLEPGWEALIREYDIQHILVPKDTHMALFLTRVSSDWVLEKETDSACLFSRR